jgi:hypothetical protein
MLSTSTNVIKMFAMDAFCIRQFNNAAYTGTQITFDIQKFEDIVNEEFTQKNLPLVDGYAPFCKHIFMRDFAGIKCGYAEITDENRSLIRSCYEGRKEDELPVLIEYLDRNEYPPPDSTYLDVILYSREQVIKENLSMGVTPPDVNSPPWRIISVKGQLCDYELPMQPITIMRNALGTAEGGSEVPLDRRYYMDSVTFWTKHVAIK